MRNAKNMFRLIAVNQLSSNEVFGFAFPNHALVLSFVQFYDAILTYGIPSRLKNLMWCDDWVPGSLASPCFAFLHVCYTKTGGWFQSLFIFVSNLGEMIPF